MTQLTMQLPHIPQTVVVVGCGGTGSRLIPPLAQLMKSSTMLIDPELVLVDFDEVEPKNLSRQNFVSRDVGKNKAVALAERYSKAYDLKITALTVAMGSPEYEEALTLFNLKQRLQGPALYIICVDNAAARRQILGQGLRIQRPSQFDSIVIDCGNEDIFGQVSIWTTGKVSPDTALQMELMYNWYQGVIPGTIQGHDDGKLRIPGIPMDVLHYENLQDGESTRSCADLDQTLAINNMMAAGALSMCQNILMNKPMDYVQWNFDLFNGIYTTPLTWKGVMDRVVADQVRNTSSEMYHAYCSANGLNAALDNMCQTLEANMYSGGDLLKASESIRSVLIQTKFEPSIGMMPRFPDSYTPVLEAWQTGYSIPKGDPAVLELYNEFQKQITLMEQEIARAQGAQATTAATTADDDDDD